MRTYTAIQAALELGVSEKTIRRWIEDNKLQARKSASNRLAIPESEIERLRLEREQESASKPVISNQDQAALVARIADLEQAYSDLVEKVAQLERRLAAQANQDQAAQAAPYKPRKEKNPFRARQPGAPASLELFSDTNLIAPDIPAGSLQYFEFADYHGVNRRTFSDQLERDLGGEQVAYMPRQKPNRDEKERWLTPAQQRAVVLFWQAHNKPYTACPACPHDQDQKKTTAQDGDSAAKPDGDL